MASRIEFVFIGIESGTFGGGQFGKIDLLADVLQKSTGLKGESAFVE